MQLIFLQKDKTQFFHVYLNRKQSTWTKLIYWKTIGFVPGIRIAIDHSRNKTANIFLKSRFSNFYISITTGLICLRGLNGKVVRERSQPVGSHSVEDLIFMFLAWDSW